MDWCRYISARAEIGYDHQIPDSPKHKLGLGRSSNQHLPQTEETGAILADREDNSNTSNKFRQQVSILEYIDSSSEYIGGL